MIIFKDILTGDEIMSDSYEMKEIDDAVYEIDCRRVTKGTDRVDIGANPSAEEAEEALEDGGKQVIDVVDSFRLTLLGDEATGSRAFNTKKEYMGHLKAYMKKVTEKMKENGADEHQIKAFQGGAQNYYTKKIAPNFKDFDFYAGESIEKEGMIVLLNYREDGVTPYVTIWKYGLTQEKA